MKIIKKFIIIFMAMAMAISLFTPMVNAIGPASSQPLQVEKTINGQMITNYENMPAVKINEEVTLGVEIKSLSDSEKNSVEYQWYKGTERINGGIETINGANGKEYTFKAEGDINYSCIITYENNATTIGFELKYKDTIVAVPKANFDMKFDEENDEYVVNNISLGEKVTLSIEPTSALNNPDFTYEWTAFKPFDKDFFLRESIDNEVVSDENTYTFTKTAGTDNVSCKISDGLTTQFVNFVVQPKTTTTIKPTINEFAPKRFERAYMVVTKVGETFVMKPNAVSTNGEIKYTWLYRDQSSQDYEYKVLGNNPTLTLTKKEIDSKLFDNNMEQIECFMEDGNEQVWISFVAFTLAPDDVELIWDDNNTVDVDINGSIEELTNNILKDNLDNIGYQTASIKLSVGGQDKVSTEQQKIVTESLDKDTEVGTMIDMNLYKKVGSEEETKVTELSAPIELAVAVDDKLVNTDTTVERTYQVVRVHDGKAETLDCEFDADTKKVTFETDRFSTYAIVYKDTVTKPDTTVDVEISKDTPVGKVTGIENVFETVVKENNKGYTAEDKAIVEAGGSAQFYLSAKPIEELTDGAKAIDKKAKEEGFTRGTLVDLSVFKEITPLGGKTTTTKLVELPSVIAVTIDIPEKEQGMKSYVIYRYHDGGVDVISTTKNADGEYIELSKDGKQLTLYIKKFSEYAIGYTTVESGTKPTDTVKPETPKTGDNTNLFGLMMLTLVSAICIVVETYAKKRKVNH